MKKIILSICVIAILMAITGCTNTVGNRDDSRFTVISRPNYYYYVHSYTFEDNGWLTGYNSENGAVMVIRQDSIFRIESLER